MSLFAIADLHLSLGTNKPMDDFPGWRDYVSRLEQNWRALVAPEDTVVIAGDISWGMTLEQARTDFAFLESLPGKKLLLKGNHDYWWSTRRKMDQFIDEAGFTSLTIVHNTAEAVGEFAVCGTRGWFYDAEADEDKKVLAREAGRLNASIDAAERTGLEPVVFLHYPPVWGDQVCEEFMTILTERRIRRCYYGHIHGTGIRRAVQGTVRGVELRLISGDSLSFTPLLVR
ncbi:MAG: serine/threonine protein phosphatase [Clostridiales bacterium]|nr:serine/threonine protein phosphatase [Clostridiales bacterium]